jgi:DNA-binding LacI/PurR family transcriptional regulator
VVIAVQPIVWQVLKELDFRIPRDLNFVSLEWRPSIGKEIAGVDQRLDKVGEEAVRLVAQKLEQNEMGLSEAPRAVFVRPVWHAGATLARNR